MSLKLFRPSLVRNISTINKITENHHCTFLSGLELSKQLQHSIKDYTKTLSDKPGLGVISVGRSLPSLKVFFHFINLFISSLLDCLKKHAKKLDIISIKENYLGCVVSRKLKRQF